MNAQKTLGFFATVLTAIGCLMPTAAKAANGDIRSIEVIKSRDNYREAPLTVGEKITIRVLLMNRQWPIPYNSNGAFSNPWRLRYTGLGESNVVWEAAKPKLGLWVSGGLRFAEMTPNSPQEYTEFKGNTAGGSSKPGCYYTTLDFVYTAQPGDFAMPIQLANSKGTGPVTGGNGSSELRDGNYYILNMYDGSATPQWQLYETNSNSICEFFYGPQNYNDDCGTGINPQGAWYLDGLRPKENWDLDLSIQDICVNAADLDTNWENEENRVWRGIQKGQVSASPMLPMFEIKGGAPQEMRLWFWTEDESIAVPADSVKTYTFAEYDPATGVKKTENVAGVQQDITKERQVGTVMIKPGMESIPFHIRALGDVGQTTKVYVSLNAPTNTFDFNNKVLQNFLTRTIQVIEPPPPSITVTVTPKDIVTSLDVAAPASSLDVELSEPYSEDLTIELVPTMKVGSGNAFDYIGIDTDGSGDWSRKVTTVTIEGGKLKPTVPLSIYANRADDNTSGAGKGILISPKVTGAAADMFKPANWKGATLTIGTSKPQILSPTDGEKFEGVLGNEPHTYDIQIADAAGDLTNTYTVIWYNTGSGISGTYTNLTAKTVDGVPNVLQVTHTLGNTTEAVKTYNSTFKVINSDGVPSDIRKITVEVQPKKKVTAILSPEGDSFVEGTPLDVQFKFNESFEDMEEAYVFLVPQDEATSNLVSNSTASKGLKIVQGFDKPNGKVNLELKDGFNGCYARFAIVVRTDEDITQGEVLSAWAGELSFGINNAVPGVTAVYMSNRKLTESGKLISSTAAIGVTKRFKADTDEPSEIDLTDTNKQFMTEWSFEDGNNTFVTNVYGSPFGMEVPYTFNNSGTNLVTVKFRDKDMTDQEFARLKEFSFYVNTLSTPAISLQPFGGSTLFTESMIGATKGRIDVNLTDAPSKPITVKIEVEKVGSATAENYPMPEINTYYVDIKSGSQLGYFYLSDIDGTKLTESKGFRFTASVTNETLNDDGVAWKDLYLPDSLEIQIQNENPKIAGVSNTNETLVAANVPFTIPWAVSDIEPDMTNGMVAVWTTSEGVNITYDGNSAVEGTFTNQFTSAGHKTVSLTVKDKDGGEDSRTYYYYVSPSKGLYIYPQGPKNSGQSTLTSSYLTSAQAAGGLGKGRAYADGTLSSVDAFVHLWNYAPEKAEAKAWAWGYRLPDGKTEVKDNGALSTKDVALDPSGNSFVKGREPGAATDSFYKYVNTSKKESFFYAWIVGSKENAETGAFPEGTANVKPYDGTATFDAEQMVTLAEYEDDAVSYISVILEPIFALEKYPEDNLGDINQDGIPDLDAVAKRAGGKLCDLLSGGEAAAEEEGGSLNDFADVSAYNGDEATGDFWPVCAKTLLSKSWAPGKPFTALDEIRGVHKGLNRRSSEGGMISDISLSDTERIALECAFAEAKAKGATTLATADAYMKAGLWTPENPTDPTIPDTDKDGIPDGIEYWIWYQATVGDVDSTSGKWIRMTGSRFTLDTIGQGEEIPSEVLAYAFNPNVKRDASGVMTALDRFGAPILRADGKPWTFDAEDFDNDGLFDIEEVLLGTNPANWDTDGDGISDFWEVMNELDPLDATDGKRGLSYSDNRNNPDGDFMAWLNGPAVHVVTLRKGTETSQWAFEKEPTLVAAEDVETVVVLESAENVFYAFEQEPAVADINNKTVLAGSTVGWKVLVSGEDKFLGAKVVVPAGTPITLTGEEAAETPYATLDAKEGLKVFCYGPVTDKFYVPVSQDGATLDKIDEGCMVDAITDWSDDDETLNPHVIYIHNQVYWMVGFDPRTAWYDDGFGYVAARWHSASEGASGKAVNTVAYTSLDEFLVLRYRYEVKATDAVGDNGFRAGRDLASDKAGWPQNRVDIFFGGRTTNQDLGGTTIPKFEVTITNGTADATSVYGADTDNDGVPDGWELYVNIDPNDAFDAPLTILSGEDDKDNLSFVDEFAGTDSCNAYSNVPSIFRSHPGINKGWYNKFFPTNPYSADTDEDGITDANEGGSWSAEFFVGRSSYVINRSFIYGEPADDGKCCIVGGGLNPCTVDTDQDLLPDPWEFEFSGIVVDTEKGDKAGLTDADFKQINTPDGMWSREGTVYIAGGMDGTWSGDASCDFDHDGLLNYQEYLVQTLRHLRYDDSETPLMGRELVDGVLSPFIKFLPMQTWDAEDFYKRCREAGFSGGTSYEYRKLGYFARPPHEWDRLFCNKSVNAQLCVAYGDPMNGDDPRNGFRIMLRPYGLLESGKRFGTNWGGYLATEVRGYASTDPRRWDSDDDGMDDYYELFHGLNPLLGSAMDPRLEQGSGREPSWSKYDRIAQIYSGEITAWKNAWTGWNADAFKAQVFGDAIPVFDAMKYPWMMGTAEADADGDGLRNSEEALMVNVVNPSTTHTDPTPLWYTDSTSTNNASFVAQYYCLDPYIMDSDRPEIGSGHLFFPWLWNTLTVKKSFSVDGYSLDWMFAFEENEGYDTDHDYMCDGDEIVRNVTPASDPLNAMDPDRRQALYFPAAPFSAAVTRSGVCAHGNSADGEMLRQFTVEAWVLPEERSDAVEQVILERVSVYGPSTLSNNTEIIRANFRLGMTKDGYPFAEFDGTTPELTQRLVSERPMKWGEWEHLSFTFDGATASLYQGDAAVPVVRATNVKLIPANGVIVYDQDPLELTKTLLSTNEFTGYATVPTAFILGARAVTPDAIELSSASTEEAFANCFRGYVDEVRVWDGARASVDIVADYAKRYSWSDLLANRESVYKAWKQGARRSSLLSNGALPPELVQHYSFQTLPSEVDANNVLLTPLGFSQKVTDNVRIDGDYVPGGLFAGWWASLPVASSVYWDRTFVPWINNNVRHLPSLEGVTADSWYWTHASAGILTTNDCSVGGFAFPDTANPYGETSFSFERYVHLFRLTWGTSGTTDVKYGTTKVLSINGWEHDKTEYDELLNRWAFDARSGFFGTEDIVPLGGAFAKRIGKSKDGEPGMWDGQGASDSWEYSVVDTDLDGLPDWWEKYASGSATGVDPNDIGKWTSWAGLGDITAREAYLRDLAKGMIPAFNPTQSDAYKSMTDADYDGILDWWKRIYGLDGDADDDQDGDQLSNRSEYQINEGFAQQYKFPRVDPEKPSTHPDQVVPDYFLRMGRLYLGEMFQDYDFMEDSWESKYGPAAGRAKYVSKAHYDAWKDPDDDGWSNWAECRADTNPIEAGTVGIDGITVGEYPVPVIHADITYNGRRVINAPVVIQAWGPNAKRIPDAEWTVGAGAENTRYIGRNPLKTRTFIMDRGCIEPGSVGIEFKTPVWYNYSENSVTYQYMTAETEWMVFCRDFMSSEDEDVGYLIANGDLEGQIGTINYKTGEVTVDFGKMPAEFVVLSSDTDWVVYPLEDAFMQIFWKSSFANGLTRQSIDLVEASQQTAYPTGGHIREGKNMFAAFLDVDGNGVWTAGEPYGVARNVDVGWSDASFEIELTDTAAQTMRMDLAAILGAGDYSWETVQAANDRGVNGATGHQNVAMPEDSVGTEMPGSLTQDYRLRIVRTKINNTSQYKSGTTTIYANEVVFDDYVNPSVNPSFTERDIMVSTGKLLDLDSSTLATRATSMGITVSAIESATYRVVLGEGSISPLATNNNLGVLFVNRFEPGAAGTQSLCVPNLSDGLVYAGKPTFRWTHPNTINKDYPLFRLQIFSGSDKTEMVYDSGTLLAPPRDSNGRYEYSPNFFCGGVTSKGHVVSTTNNYYWAVSMLDAKFTTVNTSPTKTMFRMNTTGDISDGREYGSINVRVKYMGVMATDAAGKSLINVKPTSSNLKQVIRVQAFTTPDFTGQPVGEAYVTTAKDLASSNALPVNAIIRGVPQGTYYVRAFLDGDGNGSWSKWESWGYGCWVGDDNAANAKVARGGVSDAASASTYVYTPRPYVVALNAPVPEATVYMEDCDTDVDGFPDCWEMNENNSLSTQGPITGNTFFATVNPTLAKKLAAYVKLSPLTSDMTSAVGVQLMSTMLSGGPESARAAMLLSSFIESSPAEEQTFVRISAFSLEDGIELTVDNATTGGSGDYLAVNGSAEVELVLVSSDTVDFKDANEAVIKTVTIKSNDTTVKSVTAEEMAAAKALLGSAKYYKVKLQKK